VIAVVVVHARTVVMSVPVPNPYVQARACIPIVIMAMIVMAVAALHANRHVRTCGAIAMVVVPVLHTVSITEVTG
jgi:hypothetical protein